MRVESVSPRVLAAAGGLALALACAGQPRSGLEALADSVRRHHELTCASPEFLPLAEGDTVVPLTRRVCQTSDMFERLSRSRPGDTVVIVRYGSGNSALRVVRTWMSDRDAADVLEHLREEISATHGPARVCSEPAAAGVRHYYVWRAPALLVQVSALSPERRIDWFVGLPPGNDDCHIGSM